VLLGCCGCGHSLISSQLYIYLQSVQAYISPPISAALSGNPVAAPERIGRHHVPADRFVMGATRFVLEYRGPRHRRPLDSPVVRWLIDMTSCTNAIFMFVVCSIVLVVVSLFTEAPGPQEACGTHFRDRRHKIELRWSTRASANPDHETVAEHRINVFSVSLLLATYPHC